MHERHHTSCFVNFNNFSQAPERCIWFGTCDDYHLGTRGCAADSLYGFVTSLNLSHIVLNMSYKFPIESKVTECLSCTPFCAVVCEKVNLVSLLSLSPTQSRNLILYCLPLGSVLRVFNKGEMKWLSPSSFVITREASLLQRIWIETQFSENCVLFEVEEPDWVILVGLLPLLVKFPAVLFISDNHDCFEVPSWTKGEDVQWVETVVM